MAATYAIAARSPYGTESVRIKPAGARLNAPSLIRSFHDEAAGNVSYLTTLGDAAVTASLYLYG